MYFLLHMMWKLKPTLVNTLISHQMLAHVANHLNIFCPVPPVALPLDSIHQAMELCFAVCGFFV